MNHPQHEEWVPYIFGEASPETRRRLSEHLNACPDCRAEIRSWKRSLARLDDWQLPRARRAVGVARPVLGWAFAGLVLAGLACAFLLGRLTSRSAAEGYVAARVETRLKQELGTRLDEAVREQVAKAASEILSASRADTKSLLVEYERTVKSRLDAERVQRINDCLSLKKDVDTIAINADAGLRDTEKRLAQMAVYQPERNSAP